MTTLILSWPRYLAAEMACAIGLPRSGLAFASLTAALAAVMA
jgi:hypothetical protein